MKSSKLLKILFYTLISYSLFSTSACRHAIKTTTTTVERGASSDTDASSSVTTKTVEVSDDKESVGIIGGLFGVIGDVIAFPFRVISGAIDLLF